MTWRIGIGGRNREGVTAIHRSRDTCNYMACHVRIRGRHRKDVILPDIAHAIDPSPRSAVTSTATDRQTVDL